MNNLNIIGNNKSLYDKTPILSSIGSSFPENHLADSCLIACQHILDSTHELLKQSISIGLKKENIFLIGKCYSSSEVIFNQMINDGINVCNSSLNFQNDISYDEQHRINIKKFLTQTLKTIEKRNIKSIILLDDGGSLIQEMHHLIQKNHFIPTEIKGVEQTTSGYEKLKDLELTFPVVNVSRTRAKLNLESPLIAEHIIKNLDSYIRTENIKKILIIGNGAIGSAIKNAIKKKFLNIIDVNVFDHDLKKSEIDHFTIEEMVPLYDMVVGCTGKTILNPLKIIPKLNKKLSLVSASSSDREFMGHIIRKLSNTNSANCHAHYNLKRLCLMNGGFPINFDGKAKNIPLEKIQLTMALLLAGVCQNIFKYQRGIISLDRQCEDYIINEFSNKNENNKKCIPMVSPKLLRWSYQG